jgi:hypothetical protein
MPRVSAFAHAAAAMRISTCRPAAAARLTSVSSPKSVELAAHQVGHARLHHTETAGGFRLGPAMTLDLLLERDHQRRPELQVTETTDHRL